MTVRTFTPTEILALPMPENDADADTVRDYLVSLLARVWEEGEAFSGKRPFGNSGWESDLLDVLEVADAIEEGDDKAGTAVIAEAIEWLRTA